jgi:phage RecT family recombinase
MTTLQTALASLERPFGEKNAWGLKFESECHFAVQLITKNSSALATAKNNQASLKNAIVNVAAIGISLNPAQAHAYLVPRDGGICLDVSYRGLVKLATDAGAIEWAKAVLVYEGDEFEWRGPAEQPLHRADVFNPERMNANDPMEKLRGGYCLAKLVGGGYMVDVMSAAEIIAVRDSSKAKNGPWQGKWAGEMAKKTLVKRASKSWPQSSGRQRLDHAIEILNEHEGMREEIVVQPADYIKPTQEQTDTYLEMAKGDPVDFWLWYRSLDQRIQQSLPGCEFERGTKQKMMAFFNGQLEEGRQRLEAWVYDASQLCEHTDEHGLAEFFTDMPENQREAIIDGLGMQYIQFARGVAA